MKVLQVIFLMAAALCVAGVASADPTNGIPYTNTFEDVSGLLAGGTDGYTNGETVVSTPAGWYAGDPGYAVVVTQAFTYGYEPIPEADHSQVLSLTDSVTNLINSGSATSVWIDCLINPTRYDTEGVPEVETNEVRTALFVDTNGHINVLGRHFDGGFVTRWYTMGHEPIGSNAWIRLTLEYSFNPGSSRTSFRVSVAGTAATNAYAMMEPESTSATNGTWLFSSAPSGDSLASMEFAGASMLDDLSIGDAEPTYSSDAPQVTQVYGTPYAYYADHFSTGSWTSNHYENADTNDLDGDGMFGYQENLTGTDPNDSNSYFHVLSIMYAGDSNKVTFFGVADYGYPTNWSMYRSVALTNGWDLIRTNDIPAASVDPEADGTNEWWDTDAPSNTAVFYRPSSHVTTP
jgi:hypothetical protein